jgi:hypothetical protein
MASSLISGAVALLLIITGGYVIASGILTIGETTMNSQTDMSSIQDLIHQSSMHIDSTAVGHNTNWWLVVDLNNTGSTPFGVSDYARFDMYIYQEITTKTLSRYTTSTTPGFSYALINDKINRNMWDPSETLELRINLTDDRIPNWTKIVTPNGITASTNL